MQRLIYIRKSARYMYYIYELYLHDNDYTLPNTSKPALFKAVYGCSNSLSVYIPTLPSFVSVLGFAVCDCTATIACVMPVWSSRSSDTWRRRNILAASLTAESKRKEQHQQQKRLKAETWARKIEMPSRIGRTISWGKNWQVGKPFTSLVLTSGIKAEIHILKKLRVKLCPFLK